MVEARRTLRRQWLATRGSGVAAAAAAEGRVYKGRAGVGAYIYRYAWWPGRGRHSSS
jgi:hypothetical protein